MKVEVRAARAEEVETIRAIAQAAYEPYIARMGRRPGPMDTDYAAEQAKGHLHSVLVDGELGGYLGLGDQDPARPGDLEVDNIALLPQAQGLGLLATFIRVCDWIAWASGRQRLHLYTHVTMTENIDRYRSVGFEDIAEVEEYGFRRLYMAKPVFSARQRSLPRVVAHWAKAYPDIAPSAEEQLAALSLRSTDSGVSVEVEQSSIGLRARSTVGAFEVTSRPPELSGHPDPRYLG